MQSSGKTKGFDCLTVSSRSIISALRSNSSGDERASSSLAICIIANVAELADALGLGPSVARRESSNLSIRIMNDQGGD